MIFALGIRFVGEQTAKALADHYTTLQGFLEADEVSLLQIPDIGPKVASSLLHWLSQKKLRNEALSLLKLGVDFEKKSHRATAGKLLGQSFLVTGTLPLKRDEAQTIIESHGGKILSGVSAKLNYLIAGSDPGSKLEKAEKLGVKVIAWEDLQKMIES